MLSANQCNFSWSAFYSSNATHCGCCKHRHWGYFWGSSELKAFCIKPVHRWTLKLVYVEKKKHRDLNIHQWKGIKSTGLSVCTIKLCAPVWVYFIHPGSCNHIKAKWISHWTEDVALSSFFFGEGFLSSSFFPSVSRSWRSPFDEFDATSRLQPLIEECLILPWCSVI